MVRLVGEAWKTALRGDRYLLQPELQLQRVLDAYPPARQLLRLRRLSWGLHDQRAKAIYGRCGWG